jgi:exodeoxyribonuclease-3
MRLISFNVNGIRATSKKSKTGEKIQGNAPSTLDALIVEQAPDILALQEVKTQSNADLAHLKKHFKNIYTNFSKEKKGYSGTAILTNLPVEWVSNDFNLFDEKEIGDYEKYDFIKEGRIITVKVGGSIVITMYTPNSKPGLARIEERVIWEQTLQRYLGALKRQHDCPIILCGDLNVAPMPIDIHNPKQKKNTTGFSNEERGEFQNLLNVGFIDSFRHLYPDRVKYSWWDARSIARPKNKGWRIDHFLVSDATKIVGADCLNEYWGSDHCPVLLELS